MSEKNRPIFLREWRKFRGLTLQDLGARAGINHGNLSKMERGVLPYNQGSLERLAEALNTKPASLLSYDPSILDDFWRLWDGASDSQKLQIAGYIKELLSHNR